jgi:LIM domain-binding protein 1
MVVGEPSLMGGEFGDEDERVITRLENNQFDPNAGGPSNGIEENEGFNDMSGQQGPPSNQPPPGNSSHWGPNIPQQPPPPTSTPSSCPPVTVGTPGGSSNGSSDDKKPSPVNQ